MRLLAAASRQDRSTQILVLGESHVERDEFKVGRFCKRRQVGVAPDVRRIRFQLREAPPGDLNVLRLVREYHTFVGDNLVVGSPSLRHGKHVLRKDLLIRGQPQKPHLRDAAHATRLSRSRVHPRLGGSMMGVRLKRQRQPEIDIRKVHPRYVLSPQCLPRRGFRRFVRSSNQCCRARTTEIMETRRASDFWRPESPEPFDRSPLRPPLQAAKPRRRAQRHRFGQHLGFPFSHYRREVASNQAETKHPEVGK